MSTEEDQETLYRERPFEYMMCDKYGSYHEIVGDKTLAVLHCSYISVENGKSQGNHITKTLLLKHDNLPDIEYSNAICGFFASLHHLVVKPSVTHFAEIPTLTPKEFFQHAIDNYSPLLAAIFGLSTSHSTRDMDKIRDKGFPDYGSQYLATAFTRDMILRCSSKRPFHAQLMFSNVLGMQKVSNTFKHLMSALRIGTSTAFSDKSQCEAVIKFLLRNRRLGPFDMTLVNGDNLGFLKKG